MLILFFHDCQELEKIKLEEIKLECLVCTSGKWMMDAIIRKCEHITKTLFCSLVVYCSIIEGVVGDGIN